LETKFASTLTAEPSPFEDFGCHFVAEPDPFEDFGCHFVAESGPFEDFAAQFRRQCFPVQRVNELVGDAFQLLDNSVLERRRGPKTVEFRLDVEIFS
jgi:hypothetical protein